MMGRTTGYYLPQSGASKLEAMVDRIEANPGDLINVKRLQEASDDLDIRKVMATLPEGVSEDDFVGMLKLAMLTESATDSYAAVFEEGARQYGAPWLSRFNQRVWVPDEHTHYTPYKLMLLSLGHAEEELLGEVRDVRGAHYEHCCGKSPVELTTYGVIQEYLTDHWHGLIARLLKQGAPRAAQVVNRVKGRETLHTVWYRDMTAVQVEENPEMLEMVAETICSFQMPGTSLVPHLGGRATDWMSRANVDFVRLARELVRNFSEVAVSVRRTGELLIDIAVHRGSRLGPFPPRLVQRALNRLGGPGYGLIGEAILEKVGLPFPERSAAGQDSGLRFYSGAYERIRARARRFIAAHIDLSVVTGDTHASDQSAA